MSQTLILMQGVPGSGKSTLARVIAVNRLAVILSTDDHRYKMSAPHVYDFRAEESRECHRLNQERCRYFLSRGVSVIIDNTNTQNRSVKPYVVMAVAMGIPVEFVRCIGVFPNTPAVPCEVVQKMQDQMEPLSVAAALAAQSL